MNVIEMISEEISKPFAKAIKALQGFGIPKDMALQLVTHMVEFAYGTDDERQKIKEEAINGR